MTSQPGPRPTLDVRGAVDLSALAARRATPSGAGAGGASGAGAPASGGAVIAVTDESFVTEVVQRSDNVPVVLDFWATWCEPCKQLSPVLEQLAKEFEGRFLLATVEVDANPQLAGAFQVQSIPSVFAVVKGQPIPLFQGAQPAGQIRQVLTELLRVAAANGVTGRVEITPEAADVDEAPEDVEEPLSVHHQAAYDAIEAGDLAAAVTAYEAALAADPTDEMARLGLGQAKLMLRTADADLATARDAAAADPVDVAAQCLVADLDVLGGHVDDAFARMVDTVRATSGAERNAARAHLLDLFDLVGVQDPRVLAARLKLANALF